MAVIYQSSSQIEFHHFILLCEHTQSKPQCKINQPEISWDKFQVWNTQASIRTHCDRYGEREKEKSLLPRAKENSSKHHDSLTRGHRVKTRLSRSAVECVCVCICIIRIRNNFFYYLLPKTFWIHWCMALILLWHISFEGRGKNSPKTFHSIVHFMCASNEAKDRTHMTIIPIHLLRRSNHWMRMKWKISLFSEI